MPNLTILTGAGISAESGIQTFRDGGGLWHEHDVMKVASLKGFEAEPDLVHAFYNQRRQDAQTVHPNDAHHALAELEEAWADKGAFLVITQNVDDLHRRAGTKNIAHIHGEIDKVICRSCEHAEVTTNDVDASTVCGKCGAATMRPDVVWFGEMPKYLNEIETVLDNTDIYVTIGTSGSVMPASLFAEVVKQANPAAEVIEVNIQPTNAPVYTKVIDGTASRGVRELVDYLVEKYA
jgi:NAD-dependent deacetylase